MKHSNIFKKSKLVFALSFISFLFSANDSFSQGQGTVESYQINNSGTTQDRTPSVARPPRLSVNDLILVNIWWRNNDGTADITPPTGYTAIATRRNGVLNMTSFYKLATATDVAATTFTFTNLFSSNVFWSISATRVSGVNQSMPITNISSNFSSTDITNHSISSFTPDVNYSFVLAYFATDRSVTYTHPGGYTENYDAQAGNSNTNRRTGTMVYFKQGSRALTGNITSVSSTSRPFVGIGFAINMDSTYARPCVFPVYDVNSLSGNGSNINNIRYTQIFDAPSTADDIHIRYTFSGRSSTGVTIDNWDANDGTTGYGNFWQPVINFNSGSSITDTAWAEFLVEFSGSSASNSTNFNNNRKALPCLSLTVVDLDGGGGTSVNELREMVQVTESNVAMGIGTSAITYGRTGNWMTLVSGTQVYNSIDSNINIAMAQINFEQVQTYRIRLGILGSRSSGTQRQFSLRFISYEALTTPLPVTYSYFNAKPSTNKVQLEWETTSEINNSHFEIEKTMDGENWYTIGTVEGAGNSYGAQFYSFDDNSPAQGLNVYRLKQVDWNGDFEYSSNKTVIWGGQTTLNTVNVFPNPGTEKIYINGVENPKVTVYNLAGTVQFQSENKNELNLQFLQNGVYFIHIQSLSGEVSRIKFIKN